MPPNDKLQLPKIKQVIEGAKQKVGVPIANAVARLMNPRPGDIENMVEAYSRTRAQFANPKIPTLMEAINKAKADNVITYTASAASALPEATTTPAPPPEVSPAPDYSVFDFKPEGFEKVVPQELRPTMMLAAKHTGMKPENLRAQFGGESHETWDPTTKGWQDPTDIGITQLNTERGVKEILKPRGKHGSFWDQNFKKDYGEFNLHDPHHQILGAAIYLNYLRKFALPEAGIKKPTDFDVAMSYNMGAGYYSKYLKGKGDEVINAETGQTIKDRYNGYKGLLERHGYKFE